MAAAAGKVTIQAMTMFPAMPQRTAETRRAAPTPMMAPVMVCVVDTGTPSQVAANKVIAPPVSAQKPCIGFSRVIFDPMTVKVADKTAFSMDGLAIQITPPADGKAMEFTGNTEKFTADLSLVDDPKSKEVIDALGYQNISGNLAMAGTWQPSDGKMELSKYDISVENAGTLGMASPLECGKSAGPEWTAPTLIFPFRIGAGW